MSSESTQLTKRKTKMLMIIEKMANLLEKRLKLAAIRSCELQIELSLSKMKIRMIMKSSVIFRFLTNNQLVIKNIIQRVTLLLIMIHSSWLVGILKV